MVLPASSPSVVVEPFWFEEEPFLCKKSKNIEKNQNYTTKNNLMLRIKERFGTNSFSKQK